MPQRIALLVFFAVLALSGLASGTLQAAPRTDLTLAIRLEPPHLDPTTGSAAAIGEVTYANLFEGLTRIDRNGQVQPALAESWDISDDGLTYLFHLRSGVTFHDGSTFSSSDVLFSFERARANDSTNPQKSFFDAIDAIDSTDPFSVRIRLKRPDGSLISHLAWPGAVIVSAQSANDNQTLPVGTGPFRFVDWDKGTSITLKRNEFYWGKAPKLDRVTFTFINDVDAAAQAILSEKIDAYPTFPSPDVMAQFRADKRFLTAIGNTEGKTLLAINNGKKPLDDVRVRQALAYAIDRKAVIDGAMSGLGQPIGSHYSPSDPGYVDLTGQYAYDPYHSKALLREAGVTDLKLRLVLPPTDYAKRGGEIIAQQLKAIGITVDLVPVDWDAWRSSVFNARDYDLTLITHSDPQDLDLYARDDYYFNYHSEAYKALYQELSETTDPAKRLDLIGKAQKLIADDSVNVFLFMTPKCGVWNAKLKGLWENAPLPVNDLSDVEWSE